MNNFTRPYLIAAIPGDGIGVEVVEVTWDKKLVNAMTTRMAQNNAFFIIVEARLLMG